VALKKLDSSINRKNKNKLSKLTCWTYQYGPGQSKFSKPNIPEGKNANIKKQADLTT